MPPLNGFAFSLFLQIDGFCSYIYIYMIVPLVAFRVSTGSLLLLAPLSFIDDGRCTCSVRGLVSFASPAFLPVLGTLHIYLFINSVIYHFMLNHILLYICPPPPPHPPVRVGWGGFTQFARTHFSSAPNRLELRGNKKPQKHKNKKQQSFQL